MSENTQHVLTLLAISLVGTFLLLVFICGAVYFFGPVMSKLSSKDKDDLFLIQQYGGWGY